VRTGGCLGQLGCMLAESDIGEVSHFPEYHISLFANVSDYHLREKGTSMDVIRLWLHLCTEFR
jgi:hypothetical protein